MSVQSTIRAKLSASLHPTRLEVINESHLHAGHRGTPGTGESHYRVVIEAPIFAGKSRLQRHRLVNAALAAELTGKIHALAIAAYAPGEPVP
jgi:BolA protein